MSKRSMEYVQYASKKRANPLYGLKQEFAQLLGEKKEYLNGQRRASLLVPPFEIDPQKVQKRFSTLFEKLTNESDIGSNEYHDLATQLIQESMIMEWPKTIYLDEAEVTMNPTTMEADMAPLIHRARNVVKCRTSHPTMRIKVCAIDEERKDYIDEVIFRATLVKMANDSNELRPVAGKLILTQREGTPSTKNHEIHGVSVTNDGRLVICQKANLDDVAASTKPTPDDYEISRIIGLQFHDGLLSATFPEIGVMLNSMIDRRQLNTRYAIQTEITIRTRDGTTMEHTLLSHPFLIAITNDQTEPLMLSIFWQRLLNDQQLEYGANQEDEELTAVKWGFLKQSVKYFVKAQVPNARCLEDVELLHIQCMIFLPRAMRENPADIEERLYGNVNNAQQELGIVSLRNRLLCEFVSNDVLVQKREFMQNKGISVVDCHTPLNHAAWNWLFKASEMIIDVGHKLCPSPIFSDRKGVKAKKPSTSSTTHAEICTMLNLFNRRILTLVGAQQACGWIQSLTDQGTIPRVMLIRFCDENIGSLSLMASNFEQPEKPFNGTLSSEKVRDLKQGLSEAIMDEAFPRQYDKLLQLENGNGSVPIFSTIKKSHIFSQYQTLRSRNEIKNIDDPFTVRIDALTGERWDLSDDPPTASSVDTVLESIPNLTPVDLLSHSSETPNTISQEEVIINGQIMNSFSNASILQNNLEAMLMQNFLAMLQGQSDETTTADLNQLQELMQKNNDMTPNGQIIPPNLSAIGNRASNSRIKKRIKR